MLSQLIETRTLLWFAGVCFHQHVRGNFLKTGEFGTQNRRLKNQKRLSLRISLKEKYLLAYMLKTQKASSCDRRGCGEQS